MDIALAWPITPSFALEFLVTMLEATPSGDGFERRLHGRLRHSRLIARPA